jgi:hypothetical protein
MSKRYTDTEIWDEDWFIDLEGPYQLFWFYVKDRCDHAGFWRPNFKRFEQISGHKIHKDKFLELANHEKQRIIVLDNGKWFLVNYISFHYSVLNLKNRFHNSVYETFRKNVNCENTIDYGFEVKLTSNCPQLEVNKEQRTENKEQRIKNEEDSCIISSLVLSSFDEFWKLYPKKVGKGAAEKIWNKISAPTESLVKIKMALEWQKKSEQWNKDSGQFIPLPATYLNQRRWEDEPQTKLADTSTHTKGAISDL